MTQRTTERTTGDGPDGLSRREREILDLVYARGEATAADVQGDMAEPPSYSAVRGLIRVLVEKGHLKVQKQGVRNVYRPTRSRVAAGKRALKRAVETFYGGDVHDAVAALLDVTKGALSDAERGRLLALIDDARKDGR